MPKRTSDKSDKPSKQQRPQHTPGPRRASRRKEDMKKAAKTRKPEQLLIAAPAAPSAAALRKARAAAMLSAARTRATAAHTAMRASWRRSADDLTRSLRATWTVARPGLRRAGEILSGTAAAAAVLLIVFFSYSLAVDARILPHTDIAGIPVGLLTPEQAQRRVEERIAALESAGIPYVMDGETIALKPQEQLGVDFSAEEAVRRVYEDGRTGDFLQRQRSRFTALVTSGSVPLPVRFDDEAVAARLRGHIPSLTAAPTEPEVVWSGKTFAVTPGKAARAAKMDDILAATHADVQALEARPVAIAFTDQKPQVSDHEAARARDEAAALLDRPVTLTYQTGSRGGPWKIDYRKDSLWIRFVPDGEKLRVQVDQDRLRTFLEETVATSINQERSDATLLSQDDASWRVKIEGEARDGFTLDVEKAVPLVSSVALTQEGPAPSVELPVAFTRGRVVDASGEDMGLRDQLANAQSSFAGSPAGRDYNVRKGMRIYNGILIPKGESFAFNSFLGPVDARNGWKDALTIFNGGAETRMEPGGGICQVSTTVYQAAVLAGLKVKERRAHSYFVSYYAKAPGLNGIDATIYPGVQDLVFENDTPGPVLMLAGSNGNLASVQLYGIRDRQVKLQGPIRYGSSAAPTEFEVDPTLSPGSTVVAASGHAGFSVKWNQTVVYEDGREQKNTINSVYRAIPGKVRRGPTAVAAN